MKIFVQMSEVLQMSVRSATDLNCDHREREGIRFLTKCPPVGQDLRCNPPCTVLVLVWSVLYRIQILSDYGEATICDQCTAGYVHKDIWLVGCQYVSGKTMKNDRLLPSDLRGQRCRSGGNSGLSQYQITREGVSTRTPHSMAKGTPTRLNLSASEWFVMYPIRSTSGIQPEMSWMGSVVTPRRGTTFGWAKFFHTTAIWWKAWGLL